MRRGRCPGCGRLARVPCRLYVSRRRGHSQGVGLLRRVGLLRLIKCPYRLQPVRNCPIKFFRGVRKRDFKVTGHELIMESVYKVYLVLRSFFFCRCFPLCYSQRFGNRVGNYFLLLPIIRRLGCPYYIHFFVTFGDGI